MFFCFFQDGGSLDQVLKEARRIPEEILGKVSIAVSITLFLSLLTSHIIIRIIHFLAYGAEV